MIDIKRLRKIMEEKGTDPDVSKHDLVREVLKRDYDNDDYNLENVSTPTDEEDEDDHSASHQTSPVNENFEQIELEFRGSSVDKRQRTLMEAYDRETDLLQSIIWLGKRTNTAWTHLIKARPSNEN